MVTTRCCISHRVSQLKEYLKTYSSESRTAAKCRKLYKLSRLLLASARQVVLSSDERLAQTLWMILGVCSHSVRRSCQCDDSLPSSKVPTWRPTSQSQNQCTALLPPVEVLLQQVQPLLHLSVREVHVAVVLAACRHCHRRRRLLLLLSSLTWLRPLFQAEL